MLLGAATGFLTVIGDRVAFLRPANNMFEKVLGVPPELAYMVFGDRLYANVASAGFYAIVLGVSGYQIYSMVRDKFFKKMQVNSMMRDRDVEEKLIQEAEDRRRGR